MTVFVSIEIHAARPRCCLAIVAMLRGLANMHGGFSALRGQTNARYLRTDKLRFRFASEEQARGFRRLAKHYFASQVRMS